MPKYLKNKSKTSKSPGHPYEKERLDQELKLLGQYGLKNKRELWRVQYALTKIRTRARTLLTLDEKDPSRLFEGGALMRRLVRMGVLPDKNATLDSVLSLKAQNFLDRRLQTLVMKAGLAKSIHHARLLVRQRHIRVGNQIVDIPSFLVRVDSQQHIGFAPNSSLAPNGPPGRVKRKKQKEAAKGGDKQEEENDD